MPFVAVVAMEQKQVIDFVVQAVLIDVVDDLMPVKVPPKILLHDVLMSLNFPAVYLEPLVFGLRFSTRP